MHRVKGSCVTPRALGSVCPSNVFTKVPPGQRAGAQVPPPDLWGGALLCGEHHFHHHVSLPSPGSWGHTRGPPPKEPQNWAQVWGTLRVLRNRVSPGSSGARDKVRERLSAFRANKGEQVWRAGPQAWASVGEGRAWWRVAAAGRGTDLPDPRPTQDPRLRPLWSGKVIPGRDAALRCETPVAHESLELLGAGEVVALTYGPSEDLVLTYVGPQHAGKYSCRYRSRWPLVSELSDPVELQVAGEVPLSSESRIPPPPHPPPLPSLRPLWGLPFSVHRLVHLLVFAGVGGRTSRCKGPGAASSWGSWSARREAWAGVGGS